MDSTMKSRVRRSLLRQAFVLGVGSVGIVAAGAVATSVSLLGGCGDSEDNASGGDQTGKRPPGPPDAPPTPSNEERVFALNSIRLGDTDPSGNSSNDAWKSLGFNLDGRVTNVTSASSPDLGLVCKRPAGAAATIHQDGERGTDNAFGKEIIGLLGIVLGSPSRTISSAMAAGNFTVLLRIKGLTDDPAQTNVGLSGAQLVGGSFSDAGAPAFSPTDDWPVVPGTQGTITSAYINQGVFVNGAGDTLQLNFGINGQTLALNVRNAIITFKHNPSGAGGRTLEEGTIAGVVDTEEFVKSIIGIAGRFSAQYCEGSSRALIEQTIRKSSDSLLDGVADPTRDCNALSVGIGFTAKQVGIPTREAPPAESSTGVCGGDAGVAPPPMPPPAPADAGADADAGEPDAGDAG